jgi:hypothetical protein
MARVRGCSAVEDAGDEERGAAKAIGEKRSTGGGGGGEEVR